MECCFHFTFVKKTGGTPSLEDIWTKPEEDTLYLRQQTVLSCLHCKIDESLILQTLPRHYVALCCLVHYFVKDGPESLMRESDVDAFVAQAVCIGLHTAQSIWNLTVSYQNLYFFYLRWWYICIVNMCIVLNIKNY